MHRLDRQQESLQLNAAHMDTEMLVTLQHQQDAPRTFIGNSTGLWKKTLEANSKSQANIKCGIYQGDALSPLLFCIGLNPLSHITTKSGYGYGFQSRATIIHLLYMDDIKLYVMTD